jgi:hypothetical protein
LIPPYGIAMLLAKLSWIAKHEVPFELRHRNLLPFDPHPKRAVLEHQFIILSPVEQWLNALLQRPSPQTPQFRGHVGIPNWPVVFL